MLDEKTGTAAILRGYRDARSHFGLYRIKLGAHLHIIKEHKLWKGISETWEAFLATENINPNAARQYINVAKKFVYEMDLDDEMLMKLAGAGISALEKAGRVINQENQEEMLAALVSLSERDAIQRIIEISSAADTKKQDVPTLRVLKVLREYHDLPPDLQSDFRTRLQNNEAQRSYRRSMHSADTQERGMPVPVATQVKAVGFKRASRPKVG